MTVSQIRFLNVVELGSGAVQKLAAACQEHGIRRPLIVTDKGVRAAGIVDKALGALGALEHVAVYDGTPSNPTEAAAREACSLAAAERCDGLIAVGGGSSIDCAKAVAILATHDGVTLSLRGLVDVSPRSWARLEAIPSIELRRLPPSRPAAAAAVSGVPLRFPELAEFIRQLAMQGEAALEKRAHPTGETT